MTSFHGPWAQPPGCNLTEQCVELLQAEFPGTIVGHTVCYRNLRPENETTTFGGCACEGWWGLGGPTCLEQTPATPSSIAFMAVSLAVTSLVVLRFLPVLVGLLVNVRRGILKINAAGTTYLFTWVALLAGLTESSANMSNVLYFSEQAFWVSSVAGRVRIIFLTTCVLNLVAAFVEMSTSVRLLHNIDKFRIPVIVTVIAVANLVIFTYLFAEPVVSTIIAFVVVMILAHLGIYGPVLIYVRSSKQMAATNNLKPLTKWQMFLAIQGEIYCGNRQMKRALGFTHSSSSGVDSKASKEEKKHTGSGMVRVASSLRQNADRESHGGGKPNKNSDKYKKEAKMVDFLSRSVKLGFWLSTSLFNFLLGAAFSIAASLTFNDREDLRLTSLAQWIQDIALASALYQILWFLELGYRKSLQKQFSMSRYRSESKDVALSKEMISKDDSKLDLAEELIKKSREESVVPLSNVKQPHDSTNTIAVRPE